MTKDWALDPNKTLIMYFSWPAQAVKMKVLMWLEGRFPFKNLRVCGQPNYIVARNQAVKRALAEPGRFTDFIWIDHDVEPTPSTDEFLKIDADVVGCMHDSPNPHEWAKPDVFHTAIWRCRRKVLAAIPPPWFMREYSLDGCRMLDCDCNYLRRKVLDAGFTIAHAGWAKHEHANTCYGSRYCGVEGVVT